MAGSSSHLGSGRVAARLGALALLLLIAGARCGPGSIVATTRPPEPPLVDDHGRVDADALGAQVAAIEQQRGLRFIRRPDLELLAASDARLPELLASARALEPCPRARSERADALRENPNGRCFPEPGFGRALCVAPLDLAQLRETLGRLLDAQNHPHLALAAPKLTGDPGVAIRSLLAESARRMVPSASVVAEDREPAEALELPVIELERAETPEALCVATAGTLLTSFRDRETPFRRPPLSTRQLLSAKAYRASERPLLLLGDAPAVAGCEVTSDESVGVARLLVGLAARGGAVPGRALVGWNGDREVRFSCDDGRRPWIYVAVLADESLAAAFAANVQQLLDVELPGPFEMSRAGRRVVVWHALAPGRARAWAKSLETKELVDLDGLDG